MRVRKMVFACDHCHYLFSRVREPGQCPDYGKYTVRPATPEEEKEFEGRMAEIEQNEKKLWGDSH